MKLFKTIAIITLVLSAATAVGQDMGGPPAKKQKKSRNEIVSPTKQAYSDVQKNNQDQIMFSTTPISKNEGDPSQFIGTWDMNTDLYYRVYHSKTILEAVYDFAKAKGEEFNEYEYASYSILTVVYINGKEMATSENVFSTNKESVYDWVTHSGYVSNSATPQKTSSTIGLGIKKAIHALGSAYTEGTFDVKIELYATSYELEDSRVQRPESDRSSLISTGKLKLKVTDSGMKKFAPALCYDIMKHSGDIIDPNLEDKIMVEFSKTYGKATAANIVNEDWNIKRNAFEVPTRRVLSTKVTYYNTSGNHIIIDYFINQPYIGDGVYQDLVRTSSVGADYPFSPYCIDYKKEIEE